MHLNKTSDLKKNKNFIIILIENNKIINDGLDLIKTYCVLHIDLIALTLLTHLLLSKILQGKYCYYPNYTN